MTLPTIPTNDALLESNSTTLDVQLLSSRGRLPTAGSAYAAGLDVYAAEDKVVPARGRALVDLQISVAVPLGHYARVAPRSGLASKHGIQTGAGVIDADYRGPVMVLLFNHSDTDFQVNQGDRIAQLILERISHARVKQVEKLDSTVRGAGGFGSTGGFGAAAAATALPIPTSTSTEESAGVKRARVEGDVESSDVTKSQ